MKITAGTTLEALAVAVGETLSPTDSCRDRLAAFFHWSDRQSLSVAVEIAHRNDVDLARIRRWSKSEGHAARFEEFERELDRRKLEG